MVNTELETTAEFGPSIAQQKHCPFESWVLQRLRVSGLSIPSAIPSPATIAWRTVRNPGTHRNPFFSDMGTGFEGYFVGVEQRPETVLERLLSFGQASLNGLTNLFKYEHLRRKRILQTLTLNQPDAEGLEYWSSVFGAILAQCRIMLYHNDAGQHFRDATYFRVQTGKIKLDTKAPQPIEMYRLPMFQNGTAKLLDAGSQISTLKEAEQLSWLIMSRIGMLGDPLLRMALAMRV